MDRPSLPPVGLRYKREFRIALATYLNSLNGDHPIRTGDRVMIIGRHPHAGTLGKLVKTSDPCGAHDKVLIQLETGGTAYVFSRSELFLMRE
jgi:hypothetical protein